MRIYGHDEANCSEKSFVPSSRDGIYDNANNPNYGSSSSSSSSSSSNSRNEETIHNVIQFDERGNYDYYDEESPLVQRSTENMVNSSDRYYHYHNGNFREVGADSEEENAPSASCIEKKHSTYPPSLKITVAVASFLTFGLIILGVNEIYPYRHSWSKSMISSNMMGGMTAPVSSLKESEEDKQPIVKTEAGKPKWDGFHQVCTLNSKARDSQNFCKHQTTKFTVASDENGQWPQGFSWTILKDESVESEKTFFHEEKGIFDSELMKGKDVKCRQFVTELCLDGDYVLYANSDDALSGGSAVSVCDKKVVAGEALDFSALHSACTSSSFELGPNFNKKNKHITMMQALSMSGASGASMLSGASYGILSGASGQSGAVGQLSATVTDDHNGSMPPGSVVPAGKPSDSSNKETSPSLPARNATETPSTNDSSGESTINSSANATTTPVEERADDDKKGGMERKKDDSDEQKADDDSEEEDIAPGIYCSVTYGCNDNEVGSFCNYDEGKAGMCESCGPYKAPLDCEGDGLSDKGVQDCKNKCFKPNSAPTIEPTVAPTETWELIWPESAQKFVNETFAGFKYPTFEPTVSPTNFHNSSCYMFGLICEEDFTKIGWTSVPTSSPTAFPTYIDEDTGNNLTMPHTECYLFGLICPTVTSTPTQSPTTTPALRMIDLSAKENNSQKDVHEVEAKVESEANNALEIPKKTTKKAKRLDIEETFKDQELSAYFEDEQDNFEDSKKKSNKKRAKKYSSGDNRGKSKSTKFMKHRSESSLKSRS